MAADGAKDLFHPGRSARDTLALVCKRHRKSVRHEQGQTTAGGAAGDRHLQLTDRLGPPEILYGNPEGGGVPGADP